MRAQNSNDVFYITFSKWKVWVATIFFWAIACLPLLVMLILLDFLFTDGEDIESGRIIGLAFFSLFFLFFAAGPFLILTKLNKPVTTLTCNGFSTLKKSKIQHHEWTPNTVIYRGNKNSILANLDSSQSRASKLWGGPKAAALIHHILVKQKSQDILDAINKLSPYPVKHITIWEASK